MTTLVLDDTPLITGKTTLAELQQLIDTANVSITVISRRLDDKYVETADGEMLFGASVYARYNTKPFRRTYTLLKEDLAAVLEDALYCFLSGSNTRDKNEA